MTIPRLSGQHAKLRYPCAKVDCNVCQLALQVLDSLSKAGDLGPNRELSEAQGPEEVSVRVSPISQVVPTGSSPAKPEATNAAAGGLAAVQGDGTDLDEWLLVRAAVEPCRHPASLGGG